jgi:cytochrome c biogenesis protein CcmG, thiol:disulfide interchange protein DsbE
MSRNHKVSSPYLSRRMVLKGAAATLVTGLALRGPPALANALRVGAMAPPATLVTLDGQKISTADLTGRVVILTFWATWCAPCREELPLLASYVAQHAAAGLSVLAFSSDAADNLPEVRRIAHTLNFPVGLLANSSAAGYGRIWRLPVNFTIDRAGRLIEDGWKEKNPSWTSERLEQVVKPLLASSAQ